MPKLISKSSKSSTFKKQKLDNKFRNGTIKDKELRKIKDLKNKSREVHKYQLQYIEDWDDEEKEQAKNLLNLINKQRRRIDKNSINWDLLGTGFLDEWKSKKKKVIESLSEVWSTREEYLKQILNEYHQVLYFFAVLLPFVLPLDKNDLILYRGIYLRDEDKKRYNIDIDKYISLLQEDKLPEELKKLGIFWTWHPDNARVSSADAPEMRFIAKIPRDSIDWEETILRNLNSMFGMGGSEPEHEVYLYDGVVVPLIAVEKIREVTEKRNKPPTKLEAYEIIPISSEVKYRIDGNKN